MKFYGERSLEDFLGGTNETFLGGTFIVFDMSLIPCFNYSCSRFGNFIAKVVSEKFGVTYSMERVLELFDGESMNKCLSLYIL